MLSHIWFLTLSHVTPGFPKPSPIDVWTRLFSPSSFSNPRDHTKRSERAMSIEQWSSKSNDALASVCSSAIRHGCSLHQQLEDIHGLGLAGHARLRVQQLPQGEPGLPTHAPELLSLSLQAVPSIHYLTSRTVVIKGTHSSSKRTTPLPRMRSSAVTPVDSSLQSWSKPSISDQTVLMTD
jgi:hypothetical protein